MSCDMGRPCRAIWWHMAVHRGRAEPGLRQLQWVRADRWDRAVCCNRRSQRGLRACQQCSRAGLLQLPPLQQHSCRLELLSCTNSCHRHFIHGHKPRYHFGAALTVQFYRQCTLCIMPVACTNPGTIWMHLEAALLVSFQGIFRACMSCIAPVACLLCAYPSVASRDSAIRECTQP